MFCTESNPVGQDSDSLWAGCSRDQTLVWAKLSMRIQAGPAANPASLPAGAGPVFPGKTAGACC